MYGEITKENNGITSKSSEYGQGQYNRNSKSFKNTTASTEISELVGKDTIESNKKNRSNKQSIRNNKEIDSSFSIRKNKIEKEKAYK